MHLEKDKALKLWGVKAPSSKKLTAECDYPKKVPCEPGRWKMKK